MGVELNAKQKGSDTMFWKVKDTQQHQVSRRWRTLLFRIHKRWADSLFIIPISTLKGKAISCEVGQWVDRDVMEVVEC